MLARTRVATPNSAPLAAAQPHEAPGRRPANAAPKASSSTSTAKFSGNWVAGRKASTGWSAASPAAISPARRRNRRVPMSPIRATEIVPSTASTRRSASRFLPNTRYTAAIRVG